MNKEACRRLVYDSKPPGVSQTSLDAAIDYYVEWNLMDRRVARECVRSCINLAQRFDICAARRSSQSSESPSQRMPVTPADLVRSAHFAEKIRPAVEQARDTLFGSPAPPFAAYEDAIQWLEQTAAEQAAHARANRQTRAVLEQAIFAKLEEWQILTGEGWQAPFVTELLEYAKPGDQWVHRVPIWGKTSLAILGSASRRLAEATGFSQASMVAHILAGIRPLLVPISISTSWGGSNEFSIFRRQATILCPTPNITDDQLRESRKVIRRYWDTEKKKPLTEGDQQSLALVQRRGGVPKDKGHGEQKAFFEAVLQDFNPWAVKHGYPQLTEWKATRNKYARLRKKMELDI